MSPQNHDTRDLPKNFFNVGATLRNAMQSLMFYTFEGWKQWRLYIDLCINQSVLHRHFLKLTDGANNVNSEAENFNNPINDGAAPS